MITCPTQKLVEAARSLLFPASKEIVKCMAGQSAQKLAEDGGFIDVEPWCVAAL